MKRHETELEGSRFNWPSVGDCVNQFIAGGAKFALMAPLFGMVVWAMSDYGELRNFLVTATNLEMNNAVLALICAGFILGGLGQVLVYVASAPACLRSVGLTVDQRTPLESWFWAQLPNGEELALREATTERCSPHIDVRWALGDLIKELQRPGLAGSDLLDHKVMKLLGMPTRELKPTQSVEDAKHLLALRYGGMPSRFEWDAKTEASAPGYRAFITVRAQASDIQRCLVASGQSEALAITVAAITRETWTFKS